MKRSHTLFSWILAGFLLLGAQAQGQNRNFSSLEKLYADKNYGKCIKTATQISQKYPREAQPFFYRSVSWAGLYQKAKSPESQAKALHNALKYCWSGQKRDKKGLSAPQFSTELKALQGHTHSFAKEAQARGKEEWAARFFQYLAKVFQDTTPEYLAYFPAPEEAKNDNSQMTHQAATPATPSPDSPGSEHLLSYAASLEGIPYSYGSEGPDGFDCSGYTRHVFGKFGINLPHQSHAQSSMGEKIPMEKAQPGDLIFFGNKTRDGYQTQHAGIVLKNDSEFAMIHCSTSRGVVIDYASSPVWQSYWQSRVLFARRVLP